MEMAISKWNEVMAILYFLLAAAIYGLAIAIYDLYLALITKRYPKNRPGFQPPSDGAPVRSPKTPPSGGNMAAAAIIDGSAISQTP